MAVFVFILGFAVGILAIRAIHPIEFQLLKLTVDREIVVGMAFQRTWHSPTVKPLNNNYLVPGRIGISQYFFKLSLNRTTKP